VIGGIVLFLFISLSSIVRFYTDMLWFGELGFLSVFWKILWTRIGVGLVGGIAAGLIVFINLEVARRAAPRYRFVTPDTDIAEQYRTAFRPYARLANIVLALVVAFFTGLSTSAVWERFLLWQNARPFGIDDPQFDRDVSFFVFNIPFQRSILSWLFGIAVASLFLSAVAHLFNGSIQPETNRIRVAMVVKVHVSALLGVIALLKAWAYRLDQFELVYSPRGTVTGASYTDVNAQLPALRFLMIIAIVAALIFFVNVFRFQGWLLPGAALALWAFSSILAGAIIPAAVQRFQVTPNESEREAPYIKRNIEATRQAFGLDKIRVRDFTPAETLGRDELEPNRGTIDNIRVWDPEVLHPTYQRRQAIRTYYEFDDVDVDRYELDGEMRQVMLAAREVDPSKLEQGAQNWVNTRLSYTHGFGLAANRANSITSEGLPNFLVRDLPPKGPKTLNPEEPRVYYGERMALDQYAVVKTKQAEIDYPRGDETVRKSYDGDGGIELSNVMRRLAFALRFADTDLLVSNFITPESKVLMRRNILDRVSAAAPFLKFDRDPYMVVADGEMKWIIDAYTSTDRYPYAQRIQLQDVVPESHLSGAANYMRNSVKVVVNAFDGETEFYLMEDTPDPLAATYQAAFPDLFKPSDDMSADLRRHLRYPEDLFTVQSWQYRLYHMRDAQQFYAREDAWDIPLDPVRSADQAPVSMDPYYVVMKLPWEQEEEFLLMLPFQPKDRPTLNGWVAARMDPGHYGELVSLSFPREAGIDSPQNVSARINQTDEISEQFTLWDRAGSRVGHGPIFVIPVGATLMYVQPIYLTSESTERALPELRRVIVVLGDQIGFEPTLEESLEAALAGRGPTVEEEDGEPPPPDEEQPEEPAEPTGDVGELLDQAVDHFERAEAALREGDLATYQRENELGRRAVERARERGGG
jgi:uncharacterized membrane protein (UPF0182 family)